MKTLIPFFLLGLSVTAFLLVIPHGARKALLSVRGVAIGALIVLSWIALLALAAVQSNLLFPLL